MLIYGVAAMQRSMKSTLQKRLLRGVLQNPTFGDGPIKRGNNCFMGSHHFCMSVNIFDQIEINLWNTSDSLSLHKILLRNK
jgi:hypothetical protein